MSDKMIETFKTIEDLRAFANAQQKTLIELTKKNKAADTEIKHLKKLLEGAVPVINDKPKLEFGTNDEEGIAREQLFLLKQMSAERELTYEETKKVEIFSKILTTLKAKPKDIEIKSKQLSETELLKLVTQSDDRS